MFKTASVVTSKMNKCLRYWDLCSNVSLHAAVALWCDVEPGELEQMDFSTSCMDAKREALIDALLEKRLDYVGRPVPRSDGRGLWFGARIEELIDKDGVRIQKDSLRRWFMDLPAGDRPAFLFDEARRLDLPDGGSAGEMNTLKALAIMAWILAEKSPNFRYGERPNAAAVGDAVATAAKRIFGPDTRGFDAFHKKIGKALAELGTAEPAVTYRPWTPH